MTAPQGIPTGGQFAPDTRAEPTVLLTPPSAIEYKAPLTGTIDLGAAFGDLPPWPQDMGRPHVSFDFSDGKVQTYVTAGDQTMTYWDSDFNGTINSADTGENPWEDFERSRRSRPSSGVRKSTNALGHLRHHERGIEQRACPRQPKGIPTGGQFTSFPHLEPSVVLVAPELKASASLAAAEATGNRVSSPHRK